MEPRDIETIKTTINKMLEVLEEHAVAERSGESPRRKPNPRRGGSRGVGYTRASHEETKKKRKMAARSRKINRRK